MKFDGIFRNKEVTPYFLVGHPGGYGAQYIQFSEGQCILCRAADGLFGTAQFIH